ncbi:amino acid ABC transporter permease [Actinocrispum wychmicini]|uniref:Glutamate transport system permease protein n=1 Tax=Actinocrispum wychmicini TaxID=1213861 RepID=A0A4R2JEG5_9PSEU|nr:amino acid ABC transporter permease [Actinocrispum wychmicini]TCO52645.1 glutamate transport system permease protein [Actinocrispum wychmicini]
MDFLSNYDLLGAFWTTIKLVFYSAIGSLIWGTILAAMRVSPIPIMRGFGTVYVNIFRNTPLTVLLLFTSVGLSYTLGVQLSAPDSPTSLADNSFRLALMGFIAYTSTFVCESMRSGINAVPTGQAEAARALGLSFNQVLRIIVLPQAFRSVLAPLTSVLIALIKNTTVAAVIGVPEAALLMSKMVENESDSLLLVFLVFAVGFVILTLPLGLFLGRVAKKLEVKR